MLRKWKCNYIDKEKDGIPPSVLTTQIYAFSFGHLIPAIVVYVCLHMCAFYIWRNTTFLLSTGETSFSYLILSNLDNTNWSVECFGWCSVQLYCFPTQTYADISLGRATRHPRKDSTQCFHLKGIWITTWKLFIPAPVTSVSSSHTYSYFLFPSFLALSSSESFSTF